MPWRGPCGDIPLRGPLGGERALGCCDGERGPDGGANGVLTPDPGMAGESGKRRGGTRGDSLRDSTRTGERDGGVGSAPLLGGDGGRRFGEGLRFGVGASGVLVRERPRVGGGGVIERFRRGGGTFGVRTLC
jgi:hypothetical protein